MLQHKENTSVFECLSILWKSKIIIISTTIALAVLGTVYAFLSPELWVARAIIAEPDPVQIEPILSRINQIERIKTINFPQNNLLLINQYLSKISTESVYNNFIRSFDSFDNKIEFIKKSNLVKNENKLVFEQNEIAKHINVIIKKSEKNANIHFGSDKDDKSFKLLNEYIAFIQDKEEVIINSSIENEINSQIKLGKIEYNTHKEEIIQKIHEEYIRSEYALRITRQAGIELPVENLNNQGLFSNDISIGAKALSEKLKILKEIKNVEIADLGLANARFSLNSIIAIPKDHIQFKSYRFLQSPTIPLSRDRPKRLLVILAATLAGAMLGTLLAYFRAGQVRR